MRWKCFRLNLNLSLQELLQLEDRLGNVSRGAVQTTIERFTFPHKYKKVGLSQVGRIKMFSTFTHSKVIMFWVSLLWCQPFQIKALIWPVCRESQCTWRLGKRMKQMRNVQSVCLCWRMERTSGQEHYKPNMSQPKTRLLFSFRWRLKIHS